MTARTGLLDVEVALLDAVDSVTRPSGAPVKGSQVLAEVEAAGLLGPRHAYVLLLDLAVPWRRHLPLVDVVGNWGSQAGDTAAGARYTELGLTDLGRLALAAERGEVGPVPLGLVDGTWWRGGLQPPYDPVEMLEALRSGDARGLRPRAVTGGTVSGETGVLAAGRPARIRIASTVVHETRSVSPVLSTFVVPEGVEGGWFASGGKLFTQDAVFEVEELPALDPAASAPAEPVEEVEQLVVTHVPYGVDLDELWRQLVQAVRQSDGATGRFRDYLADAPVQQHPLGPVEEVADETTGRVGTRLVCRLRPGVDPEEARRWLLAVWPLTVTVDARLPAPLADLVTGWDAGDGSGLAALGALIGEG